VIGGGIGPKRYVRPPLGTAAGDLLVFNGSTWEAQAATSIGTLDHAALTGGLPWASSGHTGTANRLAGFNGSGVAINVPLDASGGVLGYDAGLLSLAAADAGAGLAYPSAANTWTRLTLAADKGIYATGAGTLATYDLTAFARSLLDDATAGAARTTLGLDLSGDYGDGSDGALTFDGTTTYASFTTTTGVAPNLIYTLTRDVFATTISVSSGKKVRTAGFVLHSSGLTSNAGQIHNDGDPGSGSSGGANTGTEGTLQSTRAGGGGGATTSGAQTNSGGNGSGSGGRNVTGSASGAGGVAGGGAGGTGGTASAPTAVQGSIRGRNFAARGRLADNTAANGGNGGGGGGATSTTGTATGGGGGAAGGGVRLIFYGYDGTGGVISADGGNGANGASTGDGQAGGGGGGCGGYVHVHVRHLTAWGTVRALGGAFGSGSNGGSAGSAGGGGLVVQLVGA